MAAQKARVNCSILHCVIMHGKSSHAPPVGIIVFLKCPYFSLHFALLFGNTSPHVFFLHFAGKPMEALYLVNHSSWQVSSLRFQVGGSVFELDLHVQSAIKLKFPP